MTSHPYKLLCIARFGLNTRKHAKNDGEFNPIRIRFNFPKLFAFE